MRTGSRLLLVLLAALPAFGEVAEIAPGVHLLRGVFAAGAQPDGNSVILETDEGLVLIDTGRHPTHTGALIDFISARKKPLSAIINTHWHLDHVGGNLMLRRKFPDVAIYASDAIDDALTGFLADYRKQLMEIRAGLEEGAAQKEQLTREIALIDGGGALAPTAVVERSERRLLGGRSLLVGLEERAVTAGDVWVFDPDSGVLIAGDLVTLPFPFFDTACPEGWAAALDELAKVDFTLLVPGHGEPMSRSGFEAYRRALGSLLKCAGGRDSAEACANAWLAETGELVPQKDRDFARNALLYYMENHLRNTSKRNALCEKSAAS